MSKISSGTMTVVIFAVLIGLGGAFVVRQQMRRPAPGLPPIPEAAKLVYVPVAALDLQAGYTLAITDIAILSYSQEMLAKSPYADLRFMNNPTQIAGRSLMGPLKKGEAFSPEMLYPVGLGPGIAERLKPGYRAVTVPIENVGAVHGFARPGSMVDVIFRSTADRERPEVTLTLLERIEVLAVNAASVPNSAVKVSMDGTVTLAVTPPQAKILKVVSKRGELSLTLRNPEEDADFAPLNLGQPFHEGPVGDPVVMNRPVEARTVSDSTISGSRDRDRSLDRDTRDGVLKSSSEKVTLDDLLGIPRKAPKKTMEIYLGSSKQVMQFGGDVEDEPLRLLHNNGRITTPIAHDIPKVKATPVGNAQLDHHNHTGPQLAP